jgi:uncharacterized membrane protein YccC
MLFLSSLGLCGILEARTAKWVAIGEILAGFTFSIVMMPYVNFEDWTGASAYTLIAVVFAGAATLLISACVRWFWQRFSQQRRANS